MRASEDSGQPVRVQQAGLNISKGSSLNNYYVSSGLCTSLRTWCSAMVSGGGGGGGGRGG